MPFAAIDDDHVAVLHVLEQPAHAGDGRNAAAAGENRRVAGLAAGLRHDASHLAIAQKNHLRRQQFVGHQDQRASLCPIALGFGLQHRRKMPAEPHHDVAHVGQSLAHVFVPVRANKLVYSCKT